jgi:DNA replication protein DnaC
LRLSGGQISIVTSSGTNQLHGDLFEYIRNRVLDARNFLACRQRRRVRFTTAAEMVNEMVEARHNNQLSRVTARWTRYELLVIDEMGYVALAEAGAEMLFQVIAGRAEKATVIITTNLPFSEWTTVFPNARLCKAMVDRLTDRAHIVDTGDALRVATRE